VLLQKKRAQGQERGREIVQTAANVIKAINNKAAASETYTNNKKRR
jgi:hypothetical protein